MKKIFNILLVDDDPFLRSYLAAELEKYCYRVIVVENGLEALNSVAFCQFDVVITDIFMAQMDGIELIQSLRKSNPNIPVFALSGGGSLAWSADFLEFARRFGANEVFAKPVDMATLISKLEKYCQRGSKSAD